MDSGSGEEDFSMFYHIVRGGQLDNVTMTIYINIRFHYHNRLAMQFGFT